MVEAALQWNAEALWRQLLPLLPGLSVEVVERTVSTNSALLARARVAMPPEPDGGELLVQRRSTTPTFGRRAADVQPCLLVAEHQTGGRGRQGRGWQSAAGASLTFSLALPLQLGDWSGLSLAVGWALADALDPPGMPRTGRWPRIGLKWPNDLWLVDAQAPVGRKLGGVLIEAITAGSVRLAVIGVGLNVQPFAIGDTASGFACLDELEPGIAAPQALERVAKPLATALRRFEAGGFAAFAAGYAERDLLRDRPVRTTQAEGIARGVSDQGALLLETPSGPLQITSGEVSVRLRDA